jgi:TolB protein
MLHTFSKFRLSSFQSFRTPALYAAFALSFLTLPLVCAAQEKIAFTSDRDNNYEIYVMNSDGSNQTRLTYNPAFDSQPLFSADGSKIAFNSDRDGNTRTYVMNLDGSNQTLLSNSPLPYNRSTSPDGSRVTFSFFDTRIGGGQRDIYIRNSDGSNQINLTNDSSDDDWPAFSRDGSKIAFGSDFINQSLDGIFT